MPSRRHRHGALATLASATGMLAACSLGAVSGSPDDDTDRATRAALAAFQDEVAPLLDGFCATCHVSEPSAAFLADADDRATMLGWPGEPRLVDVGSPSGSRVLTKGAHNGPAWTVAQSADIVSWIELEAIAASAAGDGPEQFATPPFVPSAGQNTVDLAPIGRRGSRIEFLFEPIEDGWYLSDITAFGGTGGAHLVHPLLVTWVAETPTVDAIDRFGELEVDVDEGASTPVGGGLAVLVGVADGAELSLSFVAAEDAHGDGGELGGGCKDVAAFTAQARGPLMTSCTSCHAGGDPDAKAATDMSQVADASAVAQAAACGQILSRVNVGAPDQSGVFLASDPASGTAHIFKFGSQNAFAQFRTALRGWIEQEIGP